LPKILAHGAELLPDHHHLGLAASQKPKNRRKDDVAEQAKKQGRQKPQAEQAHDDACNPVHSSVLFRSRQAV
jgi:hypothetical protein